RTMDWEGFGARMPAYGQPFRTMVLLVSSRNVRRRSIAMLMPTIGVGYWRRKEREVVCVVSGAAFFLRDRLHPSRWFRGWSPGRTRVSASRPSDEYSCHFLTMTITGRAPPIFC